MAWRSKYNYTVWEPKMGYVVPPTNWAAYSMDEVAQLEELAPELAADWHSDPRYGPHGGMSAGDRALRWLRFSTEKGKWSP